MLTPSRAERERAWLIWGVRGAGLEPREGRDPRTRVFGWQESWGGRRLRGDVLMSGVSS